MSYNNVPDFSPVTEVKIEVENIEELNKVLPEETAVNDEDLEEFSTEELDDEEPLDEDDLLDDEMFDNDLGKDNLLNDDDIIDE